MKKLAERYCISKVRIRQIINQSKSKLKKRAFLLLRWLDLDTSEYKKQFEVQKIEERKNRVHKKRKEVQIDKRIALLKKVLTNQEQYYQTKKWTTLLSELETLSPREREVLQKVYGLNGHTKSDTLTLANELEITRSSLYKRLNIGLEKLVKKLLVADKTFFHGLKK